jgi:hypothetical protein
MSGAEHLADRPDLEAEALEAARALWGEDAWISVTGRRGVWSASAYADHSTAADYSVHIGGSHDYAEVCAQLTRALLGMTEVQP